MRRTIPDFGAVTGYISGYAADLKHIGFHAELGAAAGCNDMETFFVQCVKNTDRKIGNREIVTQQGIVQIKNNSVQKADPRQFLK